MSHIDFAAATFFIADDMRVRLILLVKGFCIIKRVLHN